jgi:hypothetical protein
VNTNDFNRDGGFTLGKAWDMVVYMLTRSNAKQSEPWSPPASTQRLVTNYEPGIQAGI